MDDPERQVPTGEIRATSDRRAGRVRWFSAEKGFGFIEPEDGGEDVFVRHSSIEAPGFRTLDAGQTVTFEVGDDGRGPRALQVRPQERD